MSDSKYHLSIHHVIYHPLYKTILYNIIPPVLIPTYTLLRYNQYEAAHKRGESIDI